jgi:hypothetical protein
MLGYKEEDVIKMRDAVLNAYDSLPDSDYIEDGTIQGLSNTIDFLNGLLAEGHIQ